MYGRRFMGRPGYGFRRPIYGFGVPFALGLATGAILSPNYYYPYPPYPYPRYPYYYY